MTVLFDIIRSKFNIKHVHLFVNITCRNRPRIPVTRWRLDLHTQTSLVSILSSLFLWSPLASGKNGDDVQWRHSSRKCFFRSYSNQRSMFCKMWLCIVHYLLDFNYTLSNATFLDIFMSNLYPFLPATCCNSTDFENSLNIAHIRLRF